MKKQLILSLDQGTTSSRAILFDKNTNIIATAQQEFPQHYPKNGWVEHDPEDIWSSILNVAQEAIAAAKKIDAKIVAMGITNQRETTVVWDKKTGQPIYNAIVWQDRRTADICQALKKQKAEAIVRKRTGLLLDPYFSATKIAWILDHVEGARTLAAKNRLAFGTIDTFLMYRLTGGKQHVTDATNASRTALFNIHSGQWDSDLLDLFAVPESLLPRVLNCSDDFGMTDVDIVGEAIPIYGVAGDQQAAAIGQCCFNEGEAKSTYGTGCFVLSNTGEHALESKHQLLTTVAYQLDNKISYCLEGSIFIAGAGIQWLRDELGLIQHAKETQVLAESIDSNQGVYLVPAFTGLGAPYWEPDVRGALFGLTRATGIAEIVRATLESVCYQTHDLLQAMLADGVDINTLKVDGGMVKNDWLVQFLADTLNLEITRPQVVETTALGVVFLAGLQAGWYKDFDDIRAQWQPEREFSPAMDKALREKNLSGWQKSVQRVLL